MTASHDFAELADRLRRLPEHADKQLRELFQKHAPVFVARAPGRLDVLGGIGDYSGSLVLEMPIAEAAFAAVQRVPQPGIVVASLHHNGNSARVASIPADDWLQLRSSDYSAMRQALAEVPESAWAAYIVGPILTLLRETNTTIDDGIRILIDSRVPEGKGVSSSAAIEVATMRAVTAMLDIELTGAEVARLCQLAENHIVGAPCGIMDQMTSALGRENEVLALRCQPAILEGFVPIPEQIAFWGIDSGIRHAVSGADYGSVRCGAFMGYRIIADALGLPVESSRETPGRVEIDDQRWHGYLANIRPGEFEGQFAAIVPERIGGRDFLARYTGTTDHVTRVDPARTYAVRAPTLHPITENARAERFRELLLQPIADESLIEMGDLMYAAHASYSDCGLDSEGTDLLVELVRGAGLGSGLFGAKITGGGSGGTVAILGRADAEPAVEQIARQYAERTGRPAYVFRGSSPGAYGMPVGQVII